MCKWRGKWGGPGVVWGGVGPSDPASHPPQVATSVPNLQYPCSPRPPWTLPPHRLAFGSGLTPLKLPFDNLISDQSSKLEILTWQIQFPNISIYLSNKLAYYNFTNFLCWRCIFHAFACANLHINISPYHHIALSTYQHINISTY